MGKQVGDHIGVIENISYVFKEGETNIVHE